MLSVHIHNNLITGMWHHSVSIHVGTCSSVEGNGNIVPVRTICSICYICTYLSNHIVSIDP